MELTDKQREGVRKIIEDEEHFTKKEREFVHIGAKYIDSKQIPLLGQMLELANDSARQLGMLVIKGLFLLGLGGLVFFVVAKIKGW